MNKILLGAALLFASGVSAQTYFNDDFSTAITDNWTLVDSDGDGNNWGLFDSQGPQGQVATSASWNQAALTPDNWMISNAIDLTSATGTILFTWKAFGQDQDWADENYSVYVGTSNTVADFTTNGADFTEVIGNTNDEYVSRTIDISTSAGQTIYVAFRHHNVTDQFRLNIDDVKVATPVANDMAVTGVTVDRSITGDRTFTVSFNNNGTDAVTAFDYEWSFDGSTATTVNVTGLNLQNGDSHTETFQVAGVTAGTKAISVSITSTDDDSSNDDISGTIEFLPPVPQYVANDSYGNSFDLHSRLSNGQAIILDFMASWCGPCESSTPALSELVENNGSGTGNVEALAITVEQTDNASVLNNLNWNGGFYNYPKFPYVTANNTQYVHYASNHGFNSGGGIPFFVMICPNVTDPANSDIVKYDVGYGAGMFSAYQTALDQCPTATMDVIELSNEEINFNAYPNPASTVVNVEFELNTQNEVTVSIINTVGQTVAVNNLGTVSGLQTTQMDVSALDAGMYIVKVKTANGEQTKRISVVK
ncbi:choice-of-anchor J domain-containing protein [Brumimicrobium sp.]|uniref:choice-of-anchor J domain-containing protein n=1 Tax=Brumimicrobium sp. TaxID=2029867 RepID=UPI003A903AA6